MVAFARAATIAIIVIVLAATLPDLLRRATSVKSGAPVVFYSPVQNVFMMQETTETGMKRTDEHGNVLGYRDYCRALPFMFHGNLMKWGEYPESIAGHHIPPERAKRDVQFARVTPRDVNTPEPPLAMLMESEPEGANLAYPTDMFRLTDRMEFIDCATNRVDEAKSTRFSAALAEAGFTYPAMRVGMNPTTQKPFDDGAFIVDATGRLFHLRMVQGMPVCMDTRQRLDSPVRKILVMENERREFHALIVTDTAILALSCDGYRLIRLPLPGFSPDTDSVMLLATPLNRVVQHRTDDALLCTAMDEHWQPVRDYSLTIANAKRERNERLAAFLFPFRIETRSGTSRFVSPEVQDAFTRPALSIAGCLLAALGYLAVHHRRFRRLPTAVDVALLGLTGLYGLIAMILAGPLREPRD
ncbi:hypothetical protein GGQ74_000307 [Desulfobaculum xiamenense]|uniref:DUF4857 domain-containing protein n=1 Tax=Desulfobaculum xiamenense TaxID=995050 RepID=A0A846QI05_9BACT|nr:DUF4857 domain-containing protein [Desulfobaculum xiamenense]NJB66667.1 hypothetical protein [Desulfobaculum xiamenense]